MFNININSREPVPCLGPPIVTLRSASLTWPLVAAHHTATTTTTIGKSTGGMRSRAPSEETPFTAPPFPSACLSFADRCLEPPLRAMPRRHDEIYCRFALVAQTSKLMGGSHSTRTATSLILPIRNICLQLCLAWEEIVCLTLSPPPCCSPRDSPLLLSLPSPLPMTTALPSRMSSFYALQSSRGHFPSPLSHLAREAHVCPCM